MCARKMTSRGPDRPRLLVLNQMAGPMTRELVEDLADRFGPIALFTGHPDTLRTCRHPGVLLTTAPTYERGSTKRRVLSWFKYLWQAIPWLWSWPAEIPLLVYSNPPQAIWLAAIARRFRGTRFVAMVHDIYPEILRRHGVLGPQTWRFRIWRRLNRWAYGRADGILTLGPHMAEALRNELPLRNSDAVPVRVVPPWADGACLAGVPRGENHFVREHGLERDLVVMYSGNMGKGHDLESLWEAACRLDRDPTEPAAMIATPLQDLAAEKREIRFVWIGSGPKWTWLRDQLAAHPLRSALLLPWQEEATLRHSLGAADIAVVSLEKELSGLAVPSKAYYFLAAGVPLLAICEPDTELADLVRDFACGVVTPPGEPEGIVDAIRRIQNDPRQLDDWRAGAKRAAQAHTRKEGTRQIGDLLIQTNVLTANAT